MIKFGEWLPDVPEQDGVGATVAQNVLPSENGSYRPIPGPCETGRTVTGCVLSDYRAKDDCDGCGPVRRSFVGTTDGVWQDGEKVLDAPGSESWEFAQFGGNVYGTNGLCLYEFPLDMSAEPSAVEDAPKPPGRAIDRVGDFLMMTGFDDQPGLMQWSERFNAADWSKEGISEEAGQQQSEREHGCVLAVRGEQFATVYTECSIQRLDEIGGTFVFRRQVMETERGLVNRESLVEWGQSAFGLFSDGFGIWDGQRLVNIDENKVREWSKRCHFHRPKGAVDGANRIVAWASGNQVLLYAWTQKRWSLICLPFCVEAIAEDEDYHSHIAFRFWSGGKEYRLAGPNMEAYLETGEFGGGERQQVTELEPLVDVRDRRVWAAIGARANCEGDCLEYSKEVQKGRSGRAPVRKSGRWMRARMRIEEGACWNHARGFEATASTRGTR